MNCNGEASSALPAPWTRHYQKGVPAEIDLPDESIPQLIMRSTKRFPKRPALEFFGRRSSYAHLGDSIERTAQALLDLGVKPGQRVALILPNCPQAVIAFHAALRIGAVVVQHNPLYTSAELQKIFSDHQALVAICWSKMVDKVQALPLECAPKALISVDITKAMPRRMQLALALPLRKAKAAKVQLSAKVENVIPWDKFISVPRLDPEHPFPKPEDIAVIQYTSGTTGDPKGAMLSHRNLYANALQGQAWMHGARDGKEISYAILPLFHAFGMTLFLTFGLAKGMLLVLFPKFEPEMVLKAAKKSPPTVFCAAPPIYERTATLAKKNNVDISTVKYAISGAMTLPDRVVELWESVTSGLLVEGYGMTEASPVALGNPFAESRKTGTIGIPFPSTWMKVVDVDDSCKEVQQGERGELMIYGPQIFQGYWNKPDETAAVLTADGWLHTGDIVTVDEDGFTTIVDRKKDIIITGGFNIAPSEVEAVLEQFPSIKECAVYGQPTSSGNDRVVAAVVTQNGEQIKAAELRKFLKERLAVYKVPVKYIQVESLPHNLMGKLLRKEVPAHVEEHKL